MCICRFATLGLYGTITVCFLGHSVSQRIFRQTSRRKAINRSAESSGAETPSDLTNLDYLSSQHFSDDMRPIVR